MMSAVDYYHTAVPAFSLMTPSTAMASDQLKCDFQNSVRRNLHSWARWRIQLNDNLVDAVLKGNRLADVEPIGACLDRDSPQRGHPTNNPKTLLNYSAAANSSTPLPTDEFYKFGIPRARVDPSLSHQQQQQSVVETTSVDPDVVRQTRPSMTSLSVPDLVGEHRRDIGHFPVLPRTVTAESLLYRPRQDKPGELLSYDDDDDDDDELVLDYFDFTNQPPAPDIQLRRRQFHRSAATLPTVPSWSDDIAEAAPSRSNVLVSASTKKSFERRGQANQSQSQQQQRQRQSVPSYVDPFSRRRQRMITARRDDVLYTTHSAWNVEGV